MLSNKGQALIEYVLIVSLITVVAISAVKIFGGYLKDAITKSSCSLVDKVYIEGDNPGDGKCGTQNDMWEEE
jgi:Flp pilus assembly pilin Flp